MNENKPERPSDPLPQLTASSPEGATGVLPTAAGNAQNTEAAAQTEKKEYFSVLERELLLAVIVLAVCLLLFGGSGLGWSGVALYVVIRGYYRRLGRRQKEPTPSPIPPSVASSLGASAGLSALLAEPVLLPEQGDEEAKKALELRKLALEVEKLRVEATKDARQRALTLLMLEYQKGSDRYENLYKAVWQNFSYMTVLAAGILTFGGTKLTTYVLPVLVLSPLAFWFFATFLPLDFYGQVARHRLARLEKQINEEFPEVGHGLHHFQEFAVVQYRWHVHEAVKLFGWLVIIGWCFSLPIALDHMRHAHVGAGCSTSEALISEPHCKIHRPTPPDTLRVRFIPDLPKPVSAPPAGAPAGPQTTSPAPASSPAVQPPLAKDTVTKQADK